MPFWASVLLGVSLFVGGVVALLGRYPLRGTLLALQGVAFLFLAIALELGSVEGRAAALLSFSLLPLFLVLEGHAGESK